MRSMTREQQLIHKCLESLYDEEGWSASNLIINYLEKNGYEISEVKNSPDVPQQKDGS